MKNSKILITGASGFIGKYLGNYLKDKYTIHSLVVRYIPNQKFFISENIIIHRAGKAHDLKNAANPNDYYESNFELTKQVFDAFMNSTAEVFIFVSSVKASADEVNGILTEDNIANPKTHYGISKYKAEEYILAKLLPENKRVYILRPCMIHGPGNKGNLNLLYKVIKLNIPWPLGAFNNMRSFCSIENFCFIILDLINTNLIPSGIYNVADNDPISTNELIRIISISLNKQPKIISINKTYIKMVAKIGDYLHLPLNSERLNKLTESYIVSNEKICKLISRPLPLNSIEGLTKTISSFKNV